MYLFSQKAVGAILEESFVPMKKRERERKEVVQAKSEEVDILYDTDSLRRRWP